VRENRDDGRRRENEPDRGQGERPHVGAQRAEVREEGGRVQERRQEDHQHQIGIELDVRDARDQAENEAAQHERDRVRHG
jgi:hypothetical protein